MAENIAKTVSKKTLYKWSIYVNIILFFIVFVALSFLIVHAYNAGMIAESGASAHNVSQVWIYIAIDLGFLIAALAFIFFQFFRNIFIIMRRSL